MFRTLIHPTDFDEPSKEAFRIAQSLAHAIAAKIVVFHIVPPPAVVTDDGRVMGEEFVSIHLRTAVGVVDFFAGGDFASRSATSFLRSSRGRRESKSGSFLMWATSL